MKETGILLPIFSLPSKYGIGDFGNEAYEFIDILAENGIKYWEILPINACRHSPYSTVSYYALNDDYLSLDKLQEYGLIGEIEQRESTDRAVYDDFKEKYYMEAYNNFKPSAGYLEFIKNDEIVKYSIFRSEETGKEKEYFLFIQYILYKEWIDIKNYANSKGVNIIGDMPVYPTFKSVDTKFYPELFQMENGQFTYEAGTPPDYFNQDGQKWNCPVYDIEKMKQDNFSYFIKRYKYNLELYDILRIDHFRGYDSYFRIPFGGSGKDGEYVDGASYDFFDELFKQGVRVDELIIEDLGDIRDETIALREHYNFTRLKIQEFCFDFDNLSDYDNESENVVVLPGSHDCSTICGWYEELQDYQKERLKEILRINGCNTEQINVGVIEYCMKCKARIVIVLAQDILGLDGSKRTNLPGTVSDLNWSWKLVNFDEFKEKIKIF